MNKTINRFCVCLCALVGLCGSMSALASDDTAAGITTNLVVYTDISEPSGSYDLHATRLVLTIKDGLVVECKNEGRFDLNNGLSESEALRRASKRRTATNVVGRIPARTLSLQRASSAGDNQSKDAMQERKRLLPKIESLIGFKFGQAPIDGVEKEKVMHFVSSMCSADCQNIKLTKPYRYMKAAQLLFVDNRLIEVELRAEFDEVYSEESIEKELKDMRADIEKRLGIAFPGSRYSEMVVAGKFHIISQIAGRRLFLSIKDTLTLEEAAAAEKKKGMELPKLSDDER